MGKPLIAHSIEHALQTELIQSVVVSTEDSEISDVAQQYGAEVCVRPMDIAGSTSSSESALLHVLDSHPGVKNADAIVFLQCTSPLRHHTDLSNALQQFHSEQLDSLLSVSPSHRFIWKNTSSGPAPLNYDHHHRLRRQDCEPEYWENGSFYIFKPEVLISHQNRLGGKIGLYVMEHPCVDIDCANDLLVAEILLKKQ